MAKKFNITGLCIPHEHYIADISGKLDRIVRMVSSGDYFTINRPRQYGKTTVMYLLEQRFKQDKQYLVIDISFEGIDAPTYQDHQRFISTFLDILRKQLEFLGENELAVLMRENNGEDGGITDFNRLSTFLSDFILRSGRNVVLMIDEVDKSCNNQLFLDFLSMLRTKYLDKKKGKDHSFHSIILAGVHDVKTLKTKIRPDDKKVYNSPWNIAVNFKVDLSLSPDEIASMLQSYAAERGMDIDIPFFAEGIYYYTSGYPFLVSYLCKIIDEELLPQRSQKEWRAGDLLQAVQIVLGEDNTNFDTLVKNLENNPELYELVFNIIINGRELSFNSRTPVIHFGAIHGILKKDMGKTRVHNRLYEQLIYDYMSSKLEASGGMSLSLAGGAYIKQDGSLDIEKAIRRFQLFIKEQYSQKDISFIERNGRLLFLAFIKPIINGKGFDFKEVQISEEKRLDVVITFEKWKYIIELKIWRGESYHQEGVSRLCDYLDSQNESEAYLLIYDLRKDSGRSGEWETIEQRGKRIFAAFI